MSVADAKGWANHTTAGCGSRFFPGGHFYLAERATEVVAHLAARLTPRVPGPR